MTPEELKYTEEHEWVADPAGGVARVGITDYAQTQLGDVVFVQLPEVGQSVTAGDSIGEIESTKSVSEVYSPLDGEVTSVNEALNDNPELLNSDPYGDGWMFELTLSDPDSVQGLLDAEGYRRLVDGDT